MIKCIVFSQNTIIRIFNNLRNKRELLVSSLVLLLSCPLFLLFANVMAASETGSTENTASIPLSPTTTKWWIKAAATPFTTLQDVSTKPLGVLAGNCPLSFSSPIRPGIYAYIALTPALPNRIRAGAGKAHPYLGQAQPGSGIRIVDGPLCADGLAWWLVEHQEDDLRGWTVMGIGSQQWVLPCANPKIPCDQLSSPAPIIPATGTPIVRGNQNKDSQCNSENLAIGVQAQVKQDSLLVIRSNPFTGPVIGHAAPMTAVSIVDGPACAGGAVWWEVNVTTLNLTGWATEANLRACSKEDGCT